MNHFTLPVTRTAHYYTLGKINKDIKDLWIVCHGYGHAADGFLKDFEGIEQEDRLMKLTKRKHRLH